ncbi:MAG: hypothetical protein HFJ27_06460 [Clostridia bacterium]|nr:hypothetical protein [Clostridia bacterium]
MKKTMIVFSIILVCMIITICASIIQNKQNIASIYKENAQYEQYKDKTVFGTEVATLINKAINQNLKNSIQQDEKGLFIPNHTNSLKIELKLFNEEELKTYQMETIQKLGTEQFVKNFNLVSFKCTKIEYHKQTQKVAKIVFEQIEK